MCQSRQTVQMPQVKRLISESQDDVIFIIIATVIVARVRSVTCCTCSLDKNLVHTKDEKKTVVHSLSR